MAESLAARRRRAGAARGQARAGRPLDDGPGRAPALDVGLDPRVERAGASRQPRVARQLLTRRLDVLHVVWDRWKADLFLERDGRFTSAGMPAARSLGLREPLAATIAGRQVQVDAVALRLSGLRARGGGSPGQLGSVDVFGAVFLAREYARPELGDVRTILDLGANTGMASVVLRRASSGGPHRRRSRAGRRQHRHVAPEHPRAAADRAGPRSRLARGRRASSCAPPTLAASGCRTGASRPASRRRQAIAKGTGRCRSRR